MPLVTICVDFYPMVSGNHLNSSPIYFLLRSGATKQRATRRRSGFSGLDRIGSYLIYIITNKQTKLMPYSKTVEMASLFKCAELVALRHKAPSEWTCSTNTPLLYFRPSKNIRYSECIRYKVTAKVCISLALLSRIPPLLFIHLLATYHG